MNNINRFGDKYFYDNLKQLNDKRLFFRTGENIN